MVNPFGPGFDSILTTPRSAGSPPPVSSPSGEPTDSVSLDPYQRLEQMRQKGMGSTSMGSIVANQLGLDPQPAPPTQPTPPPEPVAEKPAAQPIVVKEPVSEEMRLMLENMRRAGADIPEPPSATPPPPPQATAAPPSPPPPPATPPVETTSAPIDPWTRLEEMQRNGQGSTAMAGYAAQQLNLDPPQAPATPPPPPQQQASPTPPPPSQTPASPPPQEQASPTPPPAPQTPASPTPPPPAEPRPLKEPRTGDMAQMIEDMRNAGVLPGEEQAAPSAPPTPPEAPAPPPPTPKDAWAHLEEMRQKGQGATEMGSLVRSQVDLEQFDREHPRPQPPPAPDFKIAPPPQEEPVIAPGGQNRVFDDFQLPPPPAPKNDWWGKWGEFQPGNGPQESSIPGAPPQGRPTPPPQAGPSPQPTPPSQEGWWGNWGDFGAAPKQTQQTQPTQQPPPQPGPSSAPQADPQTGWWGSWGDFGAAPQAPPQAAAPQRPAYQSGPAPSGDAWWGRWGDFNAGPAPTPPVQPQSSQNDWQARQQFQPGFGPQTSYYDPRSQMDPRYFDPRSAGYYQAQPVQFPYQPHPGNMPPGMGGGGIDPMMLMSMPGPGPMLSPMFSPMMSMLPMIQMMPMMNMMMMPLMTMPFMFGGFGF